MIDSTVFINKRNIRNYVLYSVLASQDVITTIRFEAWIEVETHSDVIHRRSASLCLIQRIMGTSCLKHVKQPDPEPNYSCTKYQFMEIFMMLRFAVCGTIKICHGTKCFLVTSLCKLLNIFSKLFSTSIIFYRCNISVDYCVVSSVSQQSEQTSSHGRIQAYFELTGFSPCFHHSVEQSSRWSKILFYWFDASIRIRTAAVDF